MIVKTLFKPVDSETRKLFDQYGEQLLCVRYCYDTEKNTRYKTLELLVEETPFQAAVSDTDCYSPPQATPYVGLKVEPDERSVLDSLRKMGGFWSPQDRLWYAPELYVRRIGLQQRIIKKAGH